MPDIFDEIAGGDVFDQITTTQGDIFDQITTEKQIGFIEAAVEDPLEKIPFSPAAAAKAYTLYKTKNRLQSMDYKRFVDEERLGPIGGGFMDPPRIGQRTPEEYYADDAKRMTAYFDDLAEKERRGYSLWGRVGQITSGMPAFMYEFIATGGAKQLGSWTARNIAGKILKRHVKKGVGKAVTGAAAFGVGAAARAAAMPHRAVEAILKRRLPKGVKINEEGTMDIVGPKESKWTSLWKGVVDHYIEIASEEAGEFMGPAINKIVKRLPLMGRLMGALQRSWLKLNPNKATIDFGKKILEKGGFHGVLAEIGEEDIGWISRAVFNIEDFGAGPDADLGERLRAGLEQDIANLPAEAIAFSIPGGAKAGLSILTRKEKLPGPTPVIEEVPPGPIIEKEALINIQEKLDRAYKNNDIKAFNKILEKELAPLPAEKEKNILQGHAEVLQMEMEKRQVKAPSTPEVGGEVEKIKAAAYYNPNTGEMVEGITHAQAAAKMDITVLEGQKPVQEGFVTVGGKFVTNKEAEAIAKKAGQIEKGYELTQEERILGRPTAQRIIAEKPKRLTRKKAFTVGHQIPNALGWDEGQRRDFMKQVIGVRSMKGISLKDARTLAEALNKKLEEAGLQPEQLAEKFDTAVEAIKQLPKLKKERKIYTKKTAEKGIFESLKAVVVGIDNDSVSALSEIISGGKDTVITEVFDKGKNRAVTEIDRDLKISHDMLIDAMDKAGITARDLAEMSAAQDPRFESVKFARGAVGKSKTKFHKITINNKTYKLSDANLIHIYLMAQQEDGMRHLKHRLGGLIIFNQKTGALSDKQIGGLISRVLDNPKLKAIADIMTTIATEHNAPAINVVSNRMGEGDLANNKNYSYLEIDTPRKMRGEHLQQLSLLENKGMFIKRKKTGVGALVVRDAFDAFVAVQEAVAEYVGMAEQLREMNSLLNYQPFIGALEEQGYGNLRNNMITILERAQSNPQVSGNISRLLSRILRGAYRAVLTLNPKIAPSQYTSTIHYLAILPRKYWKHIGHLSKPSDVKEMLDNSPTAWRRLYIGAQSIEMAKLGQLDKSLRFFTGKTADINKAGIAIKTTDILAFTDGWKAAKAIVEDTTDLQPGAKEYFAAADEIAVGLWQKTQPSWDKWNRSINTSDPTPFRQTFLLFRSYYEKALSMLHVANATYVNSEKTAEDVARLAQVYGAVLSSQMINAVLRFMIGWGLWRERKTVWDLLADMAASPLAMLAVVGKGLQISIGNFIKTLGGRRSSYIKEPISSLPISIINIMLQAPDEFGKAAAFYINGDMKEGNEHMKKAMKHVYRSFGLINGVPVYELEKAQRGWFGKKTRVPGL